MSDLISREALIDVIEKEKSDNDAYCRMCIDSMKEIIEEQPTVEAKEVVHGEWIPYTISKLFSHTCSVCHCDVEEKTPFCPNCGADMRTSAE